MAARLRTGIMAGVWDSAVTFRRGTSAKMAFILLSQADLALTIAAVNMGFTELNPLVVFLLDMPALLLLFKLVIPLLIAWLVPGRLLWPSVGLLGLVVIWNTRELLALLF
jgi:hypothetical protein